jgi:hypothetical protein
VLTAGCAIDHRSNRGLAKSCMVLSQHERMGVWEGIRTSMTHSNEAQHKAYQKCILGYYYCTTVRGELSVIPARSAGLYIHVGQA